MDYGSRQDSLLRDLGYLLTTQQAISTLSSHPKAFLDNPFSICFVEVTVLRLPTCLQ